jgi:hypothetical protein
MDLSHIIRPSFHVRPEIRPENIVSILKALESTEDIDSIADVSTLKTRNTQVEAISELRKLKLVNSRDFCITERAKSILELANRRPHLLCEAIHATYLQMGFGSSDGAQVGSSWAYQRLCAVIWQDREGALDKSDAIGQVVGDAAEAFGIDEQIISFSPKSVKGIINWIVGLEPAALVYKQSKICITLRHVCPPEAVFWAVDSLVRTDPVRSPLGSRIILTEDRINTICQNLLIHPDSLGRVLTQAKNHSDYSQGGFFDTGFAGGVGRWVLLAEHVSPFISILYGKAKA